MGHPFARKAGKSSMGRRVDRILGKASGGCAGSDQSPFSSAGVESRRNRKSPDQSDMLAAGHKGAKRFARGGKIRKPAHQVNIAIVNPRHRTPMAAGPSPMAGPPGMPPMPAGAPPPGMGGPGGMMPPGMPMRARGGRLPDAGAGSGVGRGEKADWVRRRGD